MKHFLKQLTPPILVSAYRAATARRPTPPDPAVAALRARHDRLNEGLAADEVALRDGLTLKTHPDSREPFEAFCWQYPEMVAELDGFLARTAGCRRLLDIGALHGLFSLAFAANRPDRRAVAVDASPIAFARLLYNVHRNKASNVTPVECALSAEAGTVRMRYEWEHAVVPGPGGVDDQPSVTVQMRTADELCRTLGFEPDAIKIDVEGHEVKVLRGLRGTLERLRPVLFMELHPERVAEGGDSLGELATMMADLGYRAEFVDGRAGPDLANLPEDRRVVLTAPESAGSVV